MIGKPTILAISARKQDSLRVLFQYKEIKIPPIRWTWIKRIYLRHIIRSCIEVLVRDITTPSCHIYILAAIH